MHGGEGGSGGRAHHLMKTGAMNELYPGPCEERLCVWEREKRRRGKNGVKKVCK